MLVSNISQQQLSNKRQGRRNSEIIFGTAMQSSFGATPIPTMNISKNMAGKTFTLLQKNIILNFPTATNNPTPVVTNAQQQQSFVKKQKKSFTTTILCCQALAIKLSKS
jgi:hypothetical protein